MQPLTSKKVKRDFLILLTCAFISPSLLRADTASDWSTPQELVRLSARQHFLGYSPSLAFDKDGNWHLVYGYGYYAPDVTSSYSAIRYTNSRSESGDIVKVQSLYYTSRPAIAVDPKGGLHVVYLAGSYTPLSIMYTNNTQGYWSIPQQITGPMQFWLGDNPSLTSDKQGNWHLVYGYGYYTPDFTAFYSAIRYINSRNESKNLIEVQYPSQRVSHPSIAVDPDGNLHMVYLGGSGIMYMNNTQGSWSTPQLLVDLSGKYVYGSTPSLAFDQSGNWHLVYDYGYSTPDRTVIYSMTGYLNSRGESKNIIEVNSTPNRYAFHPAIAVDLNGGLHVVYLGGQSIMYMNKPPQPSPPPSLALLDGSDFSKGREVSTNPQDLISGGTSVEGAVTDGVTRLLLRLITDKPQTVTFSLASPEDGLLRSIDKTQQGSSITITTTELNSKHYGFAIYQAPENFVRQSHPEDTTASERTLTLNIQPSSSSAIQQQIKLTRPPVILIHGLWSGPEMWTNFANSLKSKLPGIHIFLVNYRDTNASYFEVNINKQVVYGYITKAKTQLRSEGIAMIQADIFGHSMGGLLGCILAGGERWAWAGGIAYKRENNFYRGDINKLITIDSPHFGSFLADFAIKFRDSLSPIVQNRFLSHMRKRGCPLDAGAVDNMQTTSVAITYLNSIPTDSTSHAIVGDFVVNVDLSLMPGIIGRFYKVLKLFGFNTSADIIPGASDTVVSVKSQRGGLIPPASSTFNHHHMDAVGEPVVNKAVELLNTAPDSSSFNSGFPEDKWPE